MATGAWKWPAVIAIAPSPKPRRSTTDATGTRNEAAVTNKRPAWRVMPWASTAGPTMKPGVSTSVTSGQPAASANCMKRASLSQPATSIAPPRCRGLVAAIATGWPPRRANDVTTPAPNSARSSITLSRSASVRTIARGSNSAWRPGGIAERNRL